jgi:hypothetical protein
MALRLNDPIPAWWSAMYRWEQEGNTASVFRLLRGTQPIPPFARLWLADVLAGKVKRKRGPRYGGSKNALGTVASAALHYVLAHEYAEELARMQTLNAIKPMHGTPSEIAIEKVATRHGISVASAWRAVSASRSTAEKYDAKLRELIERYSQ